MKPIVHAENNVKKYGGKVEDYLKIHQFMDSSKGAMCDVRHRALTHTSWFIQPDGILEKVFGVTITNSDGKVICVRDIGEDHIMEDFDGFIPTPQDFLKNIPVEPWMHRGGGTPNNPVVETEPVLPLKDPVYIPTIFPVDPLPYKSPPWFPGDKGYEVRDFVPHRDTTPLRQESVEYIPFCAVEQTPITIKTDGNIKLDVKCPNTTFELNEKPNNCNVMTSDQAFREFAQRKLVDTILNVSC